MALAPRSKAGVLLPVVDKVDKYTSYGHALLACCAVSDAPSNAIGPAQRLLSVLRLVMRLVTGVLRTSSDAQDVPCTLIGQHYLSRRGLGHAVDGGHLLVKIQEICTFDDQEAPRSLKWDQQSAVLARMHVRIRPMAKVKTRKLGREGYVKVNLGGEGSIQLYTRMPTTAVASSLASAAPLQLQQSQVKDDVLEEYQFNLPAVVMVDPLSSGGCQLALKGDLTVSCHVTGWSASFTLSEDGRVTGHLDQRQPAPTPTTTSSSGMRAPIGKIIPATFTSIGSFSGSWNGSVHLTAPTMNMMGVGVYTAAGDDAGANKSDGAGVRGEGSLVTALDLTALPAMHLPRVWSAITDAILFNEPASGRGALDLSRALVRRLSGFPIDPTSTIIGGSSKARSTAAGSVAGQEVDSDEEFMGDNKSKVQLQDRPVEPHVPPSILAQRAAGRRLSYQLQLLVVHQGSDLIVDATPAGLPSDHTTTSRPAVSVPLPF